MNKKGKIAVNNDEKERQMNRKKVMQHFENAQLNEFYHKKCKKELMKLYEKMKPDDFHSVYILCLKQLLNKDESNFYANTGLQFMAEFVTSFQAEDMHPLFESVFNWNLKTVSKLPNIRLRLCQFVNLMLNSLPADGDIEEYQVDDILKYMSDRLKDVSPKVRVQAIKALGRLQVKDDPNDVVTKIFCFHLNHDPSPSVRFAILKTIARTVYTIKSILERLLDVDMKVRRSVFIQMAGFPVNILTTEHRIILLEHGLEDNSEAVQQMVTKVLLPQWLDSYNMDIIAFLSNLKLNENDVGMNRFRTIARLSLLVIFKTHNPCVLIKVLSLVFDEANYQRCIQFDKLTIELSLFWFTLIEFFKSDQTMSNELEQIVPDLSTYCTYVKIFSGSIMNNFIGQNIFFTLIEILHTFDLSDEIGRKNLQSLVFHIVTTSQSDEQHIQSLIKIMEKLQPNTAERLQFYVDVVRELFNPTVIDIDIDQSISSSINVIDQNVKVEIATIKMKIFELKELAEECIKEKEYEKLAEVTEDITDWNKELMTLLTPYLPNESISATVKQLTTEKILKILQLIFHGLCSKLVRRLIPSMLKVYKDIICVQVESKDIELRNWALKCTATFSLLYNQLANEAYAVFSKQFFIHEDPSIWITSIQAMFQLISRYGFERFMDNPSSRAQNANPVTSSPKSNSSQNGYWNVGDEETGGDLMILFIHYLDSCVNVGITCALIDGFCMLIVHGRYFDEKVLSKLINLYLDHDTDPKVIQILSIFFETLSRQRKLKYLQLALKLTLDIITNDEEGINFQSFLQFIISSTRQTNGNELNAICKDNLHNDIACTLLEWMIHNSSHRESHRFISKLMLMLNVSDDAQIRSNLLNLTSELLKKRLDKRTGDNLKSFKQMMVETAAQVLDERGTAAEEEDELNELSDEESEATDEDSENNESEENEENMEID